MKNTRSVALVDLLEMFLAEAMTSEEPLQVGNQTEEAIPLRMLQHAEKYVSGWKSLGLERRQMAHYFHNPLVREAIQIRFPFFNQEEVELLKEEWDKILLRNQKYTELREKFFNPRACDES